MFLEDGLLLPFEGMGVLVIGGNKGVDMMAQLLGAGEAGRGERLGTENAEPDLHLIEPRGVGGDVMEANVFMALEPTVVLGLVGVEVVQDDVDLPEGIGGHDAVHEIKELHPAAAPVVAGRDQSGGHFQGGEQGGGPVPFVVVGKTGEGLAVGQTEPALGAFQGLDVRLLIHRQHHGILGGIQVQPHHIGGFLGKAGVGTDTPAVAPCQADGVLAQHPPNVISGNVFEGGRQQSPIPARVSGGRGGVQLPQDALFGAGIVARRFAAARGVAESLQPPLQKPVAPLADRRGARVTCRRNRFIAHAAGGIHDDLRSEYIPARAGGPAYNGLQMFPLGIAQHGCLCPHADTIHYTLTIATRY